MAGLIKKIKQLFQKKKQGQENFVERRRYERRKSDRRWMNKISWSDTPEGLLKDRRSGERRLGDRRKK